jgi:hypothetical protein
VSAGYDAGIQFGEYIAQTMVAFRVPPHLRPAVVGAPAYRITPEAGASPRDLLNRQCIRLRHREESVYRWEFDRSLSALIAALRV